MYIRALFSPAFSHLLFVIGVTRRVPSKHAGRSKTMRQTVKTTWKYVKPNMTDGQTEYDERSSQYDGRSKQPGTCTVADLIEVHTIKVAEDAWSGARNEGDFPYKEKVRRWSYGTCAMIWWRRHVVAEFRSKRLVSWSKYIGRTIYKPLCSFGKPQVP